ncbi:beta-lactamase/transpeptidase-like protein [Hyaloraphidium curvatum]|nr:beta-lactamase/transpeptidase-like protein [Hyaloraphidium curvatum]
MSSHQALFTAAGVAAGALALGTLAARRVLRVGPWASASDVLFGPAEPPALPTAADADGIIKIDVDTARYSLTGTVYKDFLPVAEAFLENIARGEEVGTGLCIYHRGKRVVDIAGGLKDGSGRRYDLESVNQVWSSGKTVTAILAAYCVSKGYFDYEDPVAKYWPEFAQGNKAGVRIKDLLQHRAGVGMIDEQNLPPVEMFWEDLDGVAGMLAKQEHNWGGRKVQSYHAFSGGWFLNEILRRAHPEKLTIREVMEREVLPLVIPKGEEKGHPLFVTVPETPDVMGRLWDLTEYPKIRALIRYLLPTVVNPEPIHPEFLKAMADRNSVATRSAARSTPPMTRPDPITGRRGPVPLGTNTWGIRRGQHVSFAVHSNARALARFAAVVCEGGELDGVRLLDPETHARATARDLWVGLDRFFNRVVPYTHGGFAMWEGTQVPNIPIEDEWLPDGGGWTWHGWGGYGGSRIIWEPTKRLAFGYVPSGMQIAIMGDKRSAKLLLTTIECLKRIGDADN